MMPFCRLRHFARNAAIAGALGFFALALGAYGSARAQDDSVDNSNSIWNLERRIWNGFVRGLGLRSPDEPVIEYRERSPLVVPPSRELPPPQAKATPKGPEWPKDPDGVRRKQRTEGSKAVGNVDRSRTLDRQAGPITPDQLNAPGGAPSTMAGPPPTGSSGDGKSALPSELGYFGGLFSWSGFGFGRNQDEVGTFTNEPERNALTAPPPGYQTPSPEHPYGTTRRIETAKPQPFDPGASPR